MLSLSAFSAVMVLLASLAVAISLLTWVFPAPPAVAPQPSPPLGTDDAALHLAAIQAAVSREWPGAHVRHLQEHPQGDP
jgi:hypothetical protein